MTFRDLIGPGRFIEPAVIQAAARSGSTRYPYAAWMPLPETDTQPKITTTQFIFHSMAGPRLTTLEALHHYLTRTDVDGEPTFIGDLDGRVAQVMETDQRADNNAAANRRAGSIETQDRGAATLPTTPWPDPLAAQLAGIAAFYHLRHSVPLAAPVAWDAPGMGPHRLFPEWSIYVGKTCPGDARVAQIPQILEAAREIAAWTPDQGDDDMTPEQARQLDEIHKALHANDYPFPGMVNMRTQVDRIYTIMSAFWDGAPGTIRDGAGTLARTIKNIAVKLGAKVG